MLHRFANPTRFLRLADIIQPWMAWATVLLMGAGLYMGLVVAPADYQQGESVRIMYVHVPSSWMALFCYTGMAISAAVGLIWKHPLADLIAKSTAPIGASFAFLSLLTGSLWGKPMWGTYWVWDARLTSMLVLLFLYLGYMALIEAFDDPTRGTRASSILVLVGVVNVPIIKFCVDWWNTLHQPSSVLKMSGPSIDASMLWPLLLMALAFTTYYLWVMLIRVRAEVAANRIRNLRFRQARGQGED
ncbi:MAG: heme ABC transporter permease [Rhodospirillaceae bacterium]|nr:heme ABC transporter permease [Rhodospirillaceae bacterium]